ncbi:hypothetical protein DA2_1591 [Desulfovibrio sp. A2]|nr:hypothetical protein DA2_1591 [Desulfovibrio sp. A2]
MAARIRDCFKIVLSPVGVRPEGREAWPLGELARPTDIVRNEVKLRLP